MRKKRKTGGGPLEVAVSGVVGVLIGAALAVMFSRPRETPKFTPGPSVPAAREPARDHVVPTAVPVIRADPVPDLRNRHLLIPVDGVNPSNLVRSFADRRGTSREHEALDILAPRGTKVFAVEDGTIEKLFFSKQGGITIYQFDPTRTYAYYYAHLQEYAPGLAEHARVSRGQLLGYVGTSGNAPPNTPHLHFAIFLLTEKKQWWQGTALDPYDVLR